mgnify:FL=1
MRTLWIIGTLIGCNTPGVKAQDEAGLIGDSDRPAWDPDAQTISNSSSSATISWAPPEEDAEPEYYDVTVSSEFETIVFSEPVEATTVNITGLRTDTAYTVDIVACYDEDCSDSIPNEPIQPQSWRTEVESWSFPDINGENITPLLDNTYAPNLIDLSTVSDDLEGWIMTSIQQHPDGQQVHVSTLNNIIGNGNDLSFDFETSMNTGLQDGASFIELTSSSARVRVVDGVPSLQLFVTLDVDLGVGQSILGSWTSDSGVDGITLSNDYGESCTFSSFEDMCGMDTCMNSGNEDRVTLDTMESMSIFPQMNNLMLVQGRFDPTDNGPSNLYLLENSGSAEWYTVGDIGAVATPLIKDAIGASIWINNDIGKLYYWDVNSGTAYIRYWNSDTTTDQRSLTPEGLEGAEKVRNVYYEDATGARILPRNFKVIERSFITREDTTVMMATVEDRDGDRHVTFGVLQNP